MSDRIAEIRTRATDYLARCDATGGDRTTEAQLARDVLGLTSPSCPAGHPGAALASSFEGTMWCQWCEDVERLRAALSAERGL